MEQLQPILRELRIMQLPAHSRDSGTSGNYTRQNVQHWPPVEMRHIAWLGEILSCKRFDTQDNNGWNILHHVCHQSSSCPLMLDIIWMLTREDKPKLEGSIRCALQQRTRGMTPYRWTPLHFLCQNADKYHRKATVVQALLENGLVRPTDFDVENDKVYLFLFKGALPQSPQCSFHPSDRW